MWSASWDQQMWSLSRRTSDFWSCFSGFVMAFLHRKDSERTNKHLTSKGGRSTKKRPLQVFLRNWLSPLNQCCCLSSDTDCKSAPCIHWYAGVSQKKGGIPSVESDALCFQAWPLHGCGWSVGWRPSFPPCGWRHPAARSKVREVGASRHPDNIVVCALTFWACLKSGIPKNRNNVVLTSFSWGKCW